MTGSNGQPRRIRLERNIYRRPTGLDSNYRQFLRADARTRTGDPFITSEVLYQLSYVGVCRASPGIGGLGCAISGCPEAAKSWLAAARGSLADARGARWTARRSAPSSRASTIDRGPRRLSHNASRRRISVEPAAGVKLGAARDRERALPHSLARS